VRLGCTHVTDSLCVQSGDPPNEPSTHNSSVPTCGHCSLKFSRDAHLVHFRERAVALHRQLRHSCPLSFFSAFFTIPLILHTRNNLSARRCHFSPGVVAFPELGELPTRTETNGVDGFGDKQQTTTGVLCILSLAVSFWPTF